MHHALEGIFIKGVDIAIDNFDCVSVPHVTRHGLSEFFSLYYITLDAKLGLTDEELLIQNELLDVLS